LRKRSHVRRKSISGVEKKSAPSSERGQGRGERVNAGVTCTGEGITCVKGWAKLILSTIVPSRSKNGKKFLLGSSVKYLRLKKGGWGDKEGKGTGLPPLRKRVNCCKKIKEVRFAGRTDEKNKNNKP